MSSGRVLGRSPKSTNECMLFKGLCKLKNSAADSGSESKEEELHESNAPEEFWKTLSAPLCLNQALIDS